MVLEYIKKSSEQEDAPIQLAGFLKALELSRDIILIKINWCNARPGYFTDARTLSFFVKALKIAYPGVQIILVESYCYERNDPELEKFPALEMERKEIIRKNERDFLSTEMFDDLIESEDLTYINLTEEAWAGRLVSDAVIRRIVEEQFDKTLNNSDLAALIPEVLYAYRGKSILNLTKIKGIILPGFLFFSLSMKNLFGLIPNTCRRHYHGIPTLVNTIIDMNLIYRSLFDVVGCCEAVFKTIVVSHQPHVIHDSGCAVASRDLVTLDAAIINSLSFTPLDRNFLRLAQPVFNNIDNSALALSNLKNILYPMIDETIDVDAIKASKEVIKYRI